MTTWCRLVAGTVVIGSCMNTPCTRRRSFDPLSHAARGLAYAAIAMHAAHSAHRSFQLHFDGLKFRRLWAIAFLGGAVVFLVRFDIRVRVQ